MILQTNQYSYIYIYIYIYNITKNAINFFLYIQTLKVSLIMILKSVFNLFNT